MIAIGVDPGTKFTGIAAVEVNYNKLRLVAVQVITAGGDFAEDRMPGMMRNIMDAWDFWKLSPAVVAIERQQVRPGGRTARPNDIVNLNAISGAAFVAALIGPPGQRPEIFFELPVTWRGSIPDKVQQARILRHVGLSAEALPKKGRADAIDAIGLALYAIKRAVGWLPPYPSADAEDPEPEWRGGSRAVQ